MLARRRDARTDAGISFVDMLRLLSYIQKSIEIPAIFKPEIETGITQVSVQIPMPQTCAGIRCCLETRRSHMQYTLYTCKRYVFRYTLATSEVDVGRKVTPALITAFKT